MATIPNPSSGYEVRDTSPIRARDSVAYSTPSHNCELEKGHSHISHQDNLHPAVNGTHTHGLAPSPTLNDSLLHRAGTTGTVHLSTEQYERLLLGQAAGGNFGGNTQGTQGTVTRRFGSPTVLGIISYLMVLTPTACFFMEWAGTGPSSLITIIGDFYFLGGLGMVIAGVMEWVLGNTFTMVVFITYGGFWLSVGVFNDPMHGVASALADGGNNLEYNHGVMFYFAFWSFLSFLFMIGSVRTHMVNVYIFFTLGMYYAFISAGFGAFGDGNSRLGTRLLKAGGAFAFADVVGGWYLALALICESVDMPFRLPLGNLSNFLRRRDDRVARSSTKNQEDFSTSGHVV